MKRLHQSLTSVWNGVWIFLISLLLASVGVADNFTTKVSQPCTQPPLTWNAVIWQPGPVAPTAGNTYEVLGGGLIRNPPAVGVQTFPGDSLTLDSGAAMKAKGPSGTTLNFPGVNGNPGLILNGGTVMAADNQTFTITGRVSVASDSVIDHGSSARSFTITARIDGKGSLTLINGGSSEPLDIRCEHNPYGGDWVIIGGYLEGTGDGSLGTGNITISNGATFEVDYNIVSPGALVLVGDRSLMILHQDCAFGAVSVNGAALAPGTYSYAELVAQFPDNFADGGSGSITVGPSIPPSTDSTGTGVGTGDGETEAEASSTDSGEVTGVAVGSLATGGGTAGSNAISNVISSGIADTMAPDPVSGVIASPHTASQVAIQWGASTDSGGSGLAGYRVYRNGILLATTSDTSYTDNGVSANTQYCYTIVAYDGAGNSSSPSALACATTPPVDVIPPSVPSSLIVSADSPSQITVRWNASTDIGGAGVQGYRVFRDGMLVGVTAGTIFADAGLSPDTQYCYILDAFDGRFNRSTFSAQACATTPPSPDEPPTAPSNLTAASVTATEVTLTWQDNSDDEVGFQVERAPSAAGPWTVVATTPADATEFTDVGLAPSTTYYYRVAAFN
ncbi:MAG TPA: fibronectin type III domain-containing protein [Verrucomicrobiae bacterium]|nr:fibronectin type III domain-containing protein [Verrucomicrobiae bacterium]